VANGGTGTATPSIVAGTNVTVTGTWPNQTIAASGGGGTPGGSTTQVQYNNAGAFGGITGATTDGTSLTLVAPVLGTPASGTVTNLTGTASININGTVGATTASTGAFTTLTTSSTVTHNGGTANGVTYLNGSKVLTSGSALVFDGTNLGVGTAPSAWATISPVLQIGGAGGYIAAQGSAEVLRIGSNNYFAGGFKYVINGFASRYDQAEGTHAWFRAASGTAGNTVSFTQAMTLDASGNLGIGTTSPASRLHVVTPSDTPITGESTGGTAYFVYKNNAGAAGIASTGNNLVLFTSTSGTERARIDSSGNLLVGATSATGKLYVEQSANTIGTFMYASNASYTSGVLNVEAARNTTNSSYNFIQCAVYGVAYRFYVRDSGNVENTNNSYGAISDVKLKDNIIDASPKLADLMQVKVRQYNFKSDQTHKQIGVIAQELEQIFPAMIEESPDKDMEGNDLGTTTKSVKYSVFVPMLIKAIQEQQAIIESLKARLDAANL
jgi:hypothetical protein